MSCTRTVVSLSQNSYGISCNGVAIEKYNLNNGFLAVDIITYGATITSIKMPNREGLHEEVTLCYDSYEELIGNPGPYYGCIAGRYANRIKNGKFQVDNIDYQLAINNGPNALHGGIVGFDKKIWNATIIEGGIMFSYVSVDGEEGYPGNLTISVTYILTNENSIVISYNATTDKATPINLTNHTYFNLSGNYKDKIYNHKLGLNCTHYLPVDSTQIPTGEFKEILNSVYDFSWNKNNLEILKKVSKENLELIDGGGRPGLDHCFVINQTEGANKLNDAAILIDEISGRMLKVSTTVPGIQCYSANWLSLDDTNHFPHCQHNGICLETQFFPDAINQKQFPSPLLRPNEIYKHETIFNFSII